MSDQVSRLGTGAAPSSLGNVLAEFDLRFDNIAKHHGQPSSYRTSERLSVSGNTARWVGFFPGPSHYSNRESGNDLECTELPAHIAHEARQPLSAARYTFQLLRNDPEDERRQRAHAVVDRHERLRSAMRRDGESRSGEQAGHDLHGPERRQDAHHPSDSRCWTTVVTALRDKSQ